jgi:soluble lytic murein transglycosylase-like protein
MPGRRRAATVFRIALAFFGAQPAACFATDPGGASEYRLRAESAEGFRLSGHATAPRASTESGSTAARFADRPYARQIERAARAAALDPALVHAVIHVESRYDRAALSPKGARGLMQVLPETAARYGIADPARSVEDNLKAGTRYLRDLLILFEGRLELALAAYNAGENAVIRSGHRVPPFPETRAYVPAVLGLYRQTQDAPPAAAPARRHIEYLPGTRLEQTAREGAPRR